MLDCLDDFVSRAGVLRQPDPDRHSRLSGRARRRTRRDLRGSVARADRGPRRDDRDLPAGGARRPARADRLLDQPGVHVHRRVRVLDDPQPARADPEGSHHRHLLRRRVGGGDSGHEQGHLRERAPEGHARRQHPRRVVEGSGRDGGALRRASGCFTGCSGTGSSRFRWTRTAPKPRASRSGSGISCSTPRSASWSPRRCRLPACCWCFAT